MSKITSPQDLQAELRSVVAFVHGYGEDGKPDRQVVASKLRDLADRVAAGPDQVREEVRKLGKEYRNALAQVDEVGTTLANRLDLLTDLGGDPAWARIISEHVSKIRNLHKDLPRSFSKNSPF